MIGEQPSQPEVSVAVRARAADGARESTTVMTSMSADPAESVEQRSNPAERKRCLAACEQGAED